MYSLGQLSAFSKTCVFSVFLFSVFLSPVIVSLFCFSGFLKEVFFHFCAVNHEVVIELVMEDTVDTGTDTDHLPT